MYWGINFNGTNDFGFNVIPAGGSNESIVSKHIVVRGKSSGFVREKGYQPGKESGLIPFENRKVNVRDGSYTEIHNTGYEKFIANDIFAGEGSRAYFWVLDFKNNDAYKYYFGLGKSMLMSSSANLNKK